MKQMIISALLILGSIAVGAAPEEINAKLFEFQNYPQGVIVECSANTCIPIRLNLTGELMRMEPSGVDCLYVRVLKTFWVQMQGNELIFSWDYEHWKVLSEFITGDISAVMEIENGRPVITMCSDPVKYEVNSQSNSNNNGN
jgi:hypothetical protein